MAKRDIPEINAGSMADIAFLLLIFFLVTTTMDKDTAYIRGIPKKVKVPPKQDIEIEKRNICLIKANSRNQLLVRGELIENPDDISDKVLEFYQKNEGLTREQTKVNATNPSYEGFSYPFYSYLTASEIEDRIQIAEASLAELEAVDGTDQAIIDYKQSEVDNWLKKKSSLELSGLRELKEIHFQAHVRIEVQQATQYEIYSKIFSELQEVIYELRDGACKDIFGESYGRLTKRYDMEQSPQDEAKIGLLKLLYPDRFIEVKPKK